MLRGAACKCVAQRRLAKTHIRSIATSSVTFTSQSQTQTSSTGAVDEFNAIVTRPPLKSSSPASPQSESYERLPLEGLTLSIKQNFLTSSMPTTASSQMLLANFQPHFDASPVRLLRQAGAQIVGKTNCDEFGMGSANVNSVYGAVVNPAGPGGTRRTRRRRVAGGSSGGAAAAARMGYSDLSLASDTGGSIRLPASYCGVWGLKPSYGLVSRWGLISYADSLDTVGLLGRELEDVIGGFGVLDRVDGRDPTAVGRRYRDRAAAAARERLEQIGKGRAGSRTLDGLVIGMPREYFPAELSAGVVDAVRKTLRKLKQAGATLRSVSLPHTDRSLGAYYVLASAEATSNLARYDGIQYGFRKEGDPNDLAAGEHPYAATRSEGFGAEVQKRILLGTYALSAGAYDNYFLKAQKIRRLVQADFDRVFSIPNVLRQHHRDDEDSPDARGTMAEDRSLGVDVLIHPSAVGIAPLLPEAEAEAEAEAGANFESTSGKAKNAGATSYVQDVLTVPASLAGLPALSMPVGESTGAGGASEEAGWPIGVSVVAQWGCEELLWTVARHVTSLQQ
ncbi:hypothetical protein A4X06_0g5932 [Tilletia controversa]|uniref:Glutamyl-tRNA(Gln) amidotransferase subunit A, mitochondrial n=1 Tax=Tilletia controversa TaxID=13291 RepID=A0A8X7SVP7_9BASI|nr:hypothetical protein CF328_g5620 [Tilletia controversa]KAE8244869.1 hypothetical protein A4X06_0g5932 [Tilletia controversa]